MAEDYCLRLVAPVPQERLDDVARAVAIEIGADEETLREALAQPVGALIVKSGTLETVTEAKLALRRQDVQTESEMVHRPRELGRTTQRAGATGRRSAPGESPRQSGSTSHAAAPTSETTDRPGQPSRIPEWVKDILVWYFRLRRHEQLVVAGSLLTLVGMMLPIASLYGRPATFIQLSEFRAVLVLGLLATTIWATWSNNRLYARVAAAIASVLALFPWYEIVNMSAWLDYSRIAPIWPGWIIIAVGIALLLRGTFFGKWAEATPEPTVGD